MLFNNIDIDSSKLLQAVKLNYFVRSCYVCCQVLAQLDIQSIIAVQCRVFTLSCVVYQKNALFSISAGTAFTAIGKFECWLLSELPAACQFEGEPYPLDLIH